MAEVGAKNIMSVELAIQRELAYRKKVASLFQLDEITRDLLPLQVPSFASCQIPNPRPRSWAEPSTVTRARPYLVDVYEAISTVYTPAERGAEGCILMQQLIHPSSNL